MVKLICVDLSSAKETLFLSIGNMRTSIVRGMRKNTSKPQMIPEAITAKLLKVSFFNQMGGSCFEVPVPVSQDTVPYEHPFSCTSRSLLPH